MDEKKEVENEEDSGKETVKKSSGREEKNQDNMTNLAPSNTFLTATRVPGKENKKIKFDRNEEESKRRNFFSGSISMPLKGF